MIKLVHSRNTITPGLLVLFVFAAVQACVDLWGGAMPNEFDPNDPPIMIFHRTKDPKVLFSEAERVRDGCVANGIPYAFYPIEGAGHGSWNATVDGKRIEELALAFFKKHVLDVSDAVAK